MCSSDSTEGKVILNYFFQVLQVSVPLFNSKMCFGSFPYHLIGMSGRPHPPYVLF